MEASCDSRSDDRCDDWRLTKGDDDDDDSEVKEDGGCNARDDDNDKDDDDDDHDDCCELELAASESASAPSWDVD